MGADGKSIALPDLKNPPGSHNERHSLWIKKGHTGYQSNIWNNYDF